MPDRRYFVQHIGGDPIALRFVQFDTARELSDGTWECAWTTEAADRQEWDVSTEAHMLRDLLGVGVVRSTLPDPLDIDHEARQSEMRFRPEPPPPDKPIPDDELPWWQRL